MTPPTLGNSVIWWYQIPAAVNPQWNHKSNLWTKLLTSWLSPHGNWVCRARTEMPVIHKLLHIPCPFCAYLVNKMWKLNMLSDANRSVAAFSGLKMESLPPKKQQNNNKYSLSCHSKFVWVFPCWIEKNIFGRWCKNNIGTHLISYFVSI